MKTCAKCDRTLPVEDFHIESSARGRKSSCRYCVKEYGAARRSRVLQPPAEGYCSTCDRTLPATDFAIDRCTATGLKTQCRECYRLYKIEWLYKITPERYLAMTENGCHICGSFDTLVVDHDHSCCPGPRSCGGCVRGILCKIHNTGLGYFQDDPEVMRAAAEYLAADLVRT